VKSAVEQPARLVVEITSTVPVVPAVDPPPRPVRQSRPVKFDRVVVTILRGDTPIGTGIEVNSEETGPAIITLASLFPKSDGSAMYSARAMVDYGEYKDLPLSSVQPLGVNPDLAPALAYCTVSENGVAIEGFDTGPAEDIQQGEYFYFQSSPDKHEVAAEKSSPFRLVDVGTGMSHQLLGSIRSPRDRDVLIVSHVYDPIGENRAKPFVVEGLYDQDREPFVVLLAGTVHFDKGTADAYRLSRQDYSYGYIVYPGQLMKTIPTRP
jgi:hypothetical protein